MNSFNEFIKQLLTQEFLDSAVMGYTSQIILVAGSLGTIFYILAFGFSLVKTVYISKGQQAVNFNELARGFILLTLIASYHLYMGPVVYIGELINKGTALNFDDMPKYNEYIDKRINDATYGTLGQDDKKRLKENKYNLDNQNNSNKDSDLNSVPLQSNTTNTAGSMTDTADPADSEGKLKSWTSIFDLVGSPIYVIGIIVSIIFGVISLVIKIVMYVLLIYLVKIMYIVGPLALCFSIIPIWKEKVFEWFSTFVNILLTFTTLNILDALLIHNIVNAFTASGSSAYESYAPRMAFDIVIIILYLMPFWITAKFVGNDSAGKVLQTGMQAASMALGGYAAGSSMGKALTEKTMSGEAANTAKDAFKE